MVDAVYRHGALPLSFGKSDFGEKQQGDWECSWGGKKKDKVWNLNLFSGLCFTMFLAADN